jgi:hypothetical protein
MGLFGGKKVYVASTVYNMAGPEEDRVDYLKSVVGSNVISNTRFSMPDVISKCYLEGPGIKARTFYRWALNNYTDIGVPTTSIRGHPDLDHMTIQGAIPRNAGDEVQLQEINFGPPEFSYWAEQWMLENHPELIDTEWTSDIDAAGWIIITFADSTTATFDPNIILQGTGGRDFALYYYLTYLLKEAGEANFKTRLYIYRMGAGDNPTLDEVPFEETARPGFLPVIPIRYENEFLSSTYMPEAYALAKKAYKKATSGGKLDDLIDKIADNDDLDDIDHAYMMYGVSLNALDNSARRYLFQFFDLLEGEQVYVETDYNVWYEDMLTWNHEIDKYRDTSSETPRLITYDDDPNDPDNNAYVPYPHKKQNSFHVRPVGNIDIGFHMEIAWSYITKSSGSGLKKTGAKKGEVWLTTGIMHTQPNGDIVVGDSELIQYARNADSTIEIHWQKGDDYWETLTIVGLIHKNHIYKKKSVEITAKEALEDTEESGFIVPLHYETLREMSLIDATQMMTAGTYLVFNSYKVVKKKWYQTGIFKIFIFIAIIVISVVTMGAAAPGLLGAAAAVGAALGFSGIVAIIVGAIANAIAAMILSQILMTVSVTVFGDKLGALIATIASAVAMTVGGSLMAGQTLSMAWGNMMNAVNILQLTSSVGGGISAYINASTAELMAKTQEIQEDYKQASNKIQQMMIEEFGYGRFEFDPNQLTNNNPYGLTETPQSFLDRTLMTGGDIADMTNGMLSDFASLTLDLNAIHR